MSPLDPADIESAGSIPILAGIETEYGFTVEGHSADDQIDDGIAFVRSFPDQAFVGWDYRYESPRSDLRGFTLDRLAIDPEDAKRDAGRSYGSPHEVRSDRILTNGARFYNDHGHPEYATPECFGISELVLHDKAGEMVLQQAAKAYSSQIGREVRVYKNNTDFHGSSYGTHESYLVPRKLGYDGLFPAVLPILFARQVLTGAGKVGSEHGRSSVFQMSARADFFVEAANAETLYRRPIFNTRDEPHAKAADWIRLHVISGDANMIPGCTAMKVGLVKLAIRLAIAGLSPVWKLAEPVRSFQEVSRDETYEYRVPLQESSWTTCYEILESYFAAAEHGLQLDPELNAIVASCRKLLEDLRGPRELIGRRIDWAAKRRVLETYIDDSGSDWRDEALRAYDLEYHNIDPAEGLYFALEKMEEVEPYPPLASRIERLTSAPERTRAWARGLAVQRFSPQLARASWRSLVFSLDDKEIEVELLPNVIYPSQLAEARNVGTFIDVLKSVA